jgi:shikimate kinase
MANNIVLVGFMATGKSTVGRELARRLSLKMVDTDDMIEEKAGKTISEIFEEEGEAVFREMESQAARDVSYLSGHVIITGGGIVLRDQNMDALKKAGPVICLTASPEVILKRNQGTSHRPILQTGDPLKKIRDLLEARSPFYARADYTIDTSNRTLQEVGDRIIEILSEQGSEILS